MLALKEIRQYIDDLCIAENVYIGKLDNKKPKSIGIYPRPGTGPPAIPLGGMKNSSHDIRQISILIHWNKNVNESEQAANQLFEHFRNVGEIKMGESDISAVFLMVPEPQPVGTDDIGIYEYVIWLDFYYVRK